jgi:hypothetical protein
MRDLPLAAVGRPAPFAVTAPAYSAAVLGWLAASAAFAAAATELAGGALFHTSVVLAAHLVGVVFFPLAVAAAVWQLLPVMLRNDPPTARLRPLVLALVVVGGAPLAVGVGLDRTRLAAAGAVLLAGGMALLVVEAVGLVRGAPPGKTIVVSRPAVALAVGHAAAAFLLGAVLLAGDAEPLGIPYERFLLLHVSVAVLGWLTVLISAVGRTLVPMLALAAADRRRPQLGAELLVVAGLWVYAAGLAAGVRALVAAGIAVMLAGIAPAALIFLRAAARGKLGVREGPVAHAAFGLVLAAQAAGVGLAGALGALDPRRAAIAAVLLVGLGWAAGVIVGHLGKLVSLSGWGSWPPGPRPKQAELYPRRLWQVEVVLFVVAVELLAGGVLLQSPATARVGGAALVAAALVAVGGTAETLRRVAAARARS